MKRYRGDILLFILVLVIALIAGLLFLNGPLGTTVRVTVDGEVFGEYSLSRDTTIDICGTNTLVIEKGMAFLSEADCPDKLCVKMGRIYKKGQTIICLPNKVVVEIMGEEADIVDGVAGGVYGTK